MSAKYKEHPGLKELCDMADGCNQAEDRIQPALPGSAPRTTDPRHQDLHKADARFPARQLVTRGSLSRQTPSKTGKGRTFGKICIYRLPPWLRDLPPLFTLGENCGVKCDALCRVAATLRRALCEIEVEFNDDGSPRTPVGAALAAAKWMCLGEKPRNEWLEVLAAGGDPEYGGHSITEADLRAARRALAVIVLRGAIQRAIDHDKRRKEEKRPHKEEQARRKDLARCTGGDGEGGRGAGGGGGGHEEEEVQEEEEEDAEEGIDGEVEFLDYEIDNGGLDAAEEGEGEGEVHQHQHRQPRQAQRERQKQEEAAYQREMNKRFAILRKHHGFADGLACADDHSCVTVTHDALCATGFLQREEQLDPAHCDDALLLPWLKRTRVWKQRAKDVTPRQVVEVFNRALAAVAQAHNRGLALSGSGAATLRRSLPAGALFTTLLNFCIAPLSQLAVLRAMRHLRWPALGKEYRSLSTHVAGPLQDLVHSLLWRPGMGPEGSSADAAYARSGAAAAAPAPPPPPLSSRGGGAAAPLSVAERLFGYRIRLFTTWELFQVAMGVAASLIGQAGMWRNYSQARRRGGQPRVPRPRYKASRTPKNSRKIKLPPGSALGMVKVRRGSARPDQAAAAGAGAVGEGGVGSTRLVHAVRVPSAVPGIDITPVGRPLTHLWGDRLPDQWRTRQPRRASQRLAPPFTTKCAQHHFLLLGAKHADFVVRDCIYGGERSVRRDLTSAASTHLLASFAALGAVRKEEGRVREHGGPGECVFAFDAAGAAEVMPLPEPLTVKLRGRKSAHLSLPYFVREPRPEEEVQQHEAELPLVEEPGAGGEARRPTMDIIEEAHGELRGNVVRDDSQEAVRAAQAQLNSTLLKVARRCTSPKLHNAWWVVKRPAADGDGQGGNPVETAFVSAEETEALFAEALPLMGTVHIKEPRLQAAQRAITRLQDEVPHIVLMPRLHAHLNRPVHRPGSGTVAAQLGLDQVAASLIQEHEARVSEEGEQALQLAHQAKEVADGLCHRQVSATWSSQVQVAKTEQDVLDLLGDTVQAVARGAGLLPEMKVPKPRAPPNETSGKKEERAERGRALRASRKQWQQRVKQAMAKQDEGEAKRTSTGAAAQGAAAGTGKKKRRRKRKQQGKGDAQPETTGAERAPGGSTEGAGGGAEGERAPGGSEQPSTGDAQPQAPAAPPDAEDEGTPPAKRRYDLRSASRMQTRGRSKGEASSEWVTEWPSGSSSDAEEPDDGSSPSEECELGGRKRPRRAGNRGGSKRRKRRRRRRRRRKKGGAVQSGPGPTQAGAAAAAGQHDVPGEGLDDDEAAQAGPAGPGGADPGTEGAPPPKHELRVGGIDLGARCIFSAVLLAIQVSATKLGDGMKEVVWGLHNLDPTEFQTRFRPRLEQCPIGAANLEDERNERRGAIQRMLAATRRQIASINRRLKFLEGSGDGRLTPAQLISIKESAWGRGKGRDVIRRAEEEGDLEAIKVLRRRIARSRCNLRAAKRRKYRQVHNKIEHLWRSTEVWLGSSVHAAFTGIIPPSLLRLRRGKKESDISPTKWTLQQGRVFGAPKRLQRYGQELRQGFVRYGPGGRRTYGMGCASFKPTWEAYTTSLCPSCKQLVDVGGQEVFMCPCGWTESRDGGAARLIMLSGMQGLDFDVRDAFRRQRGKGDWEYDFPKGTDLDGDDGGGGDDSGGAGGGAGAGDRGGAGAAGGDGGSGGHSH